MVGRLGRLIFTSILVCLVRSFFTAAYAADVVTFKPIGPCGGNIRGVLIHPSDSNVLFARNGNVFMSTDAGESWSLRAGAESGYFPPGVNDICFDPLDDNSIYVASYTGLFKTENAGQTWTDMGRFGANMTAIAVSSTNRNELYALKSGWEDFYKSSDRGLTWELKKISPTEHARFLCITIDPADGNTIYGAGLSASSGKGNVWKSTNAGESWVCIHANIPGTNLLHLVVIDPHNSDVLYVADNKGNLYRSLDRGGAWAPFYMPYPYSNPCIVTTVAVDPFDSEHILVGARYLWETLDGGLTWNYSIIQEPFNSSSYSLENINGLSFDLRNTGVVYATLEGQSGVYKSISNAAPWSFLPKCDGLHGTTCLSIGVSPRNSSTILVGTADNGIARSTDKGASWQYCNDDFAVSTLVGAGFLFHPIDPLTIYAGQWYDVYRSDNGGQTWNVTGSNFSYVNSISMDPLNPNILYAGANGGAFKSTDCGATWACINGILGTKTFWYTKCIPDLDGNLFMNVLTSDGTVGIYKMRSGAPDWTRTLALSCEASNLAVSPINPGLILAAGGCYQMLYRSKDKGETWSAVPGTERIFSGGRFVFDIFDPDLIYYLSEKKGLYKTEDGGFTWQRMEFGFCLSGSELAMDPDDRTQLYLGTRGGGAYALRIVCDLATFAPAFGLFSSEGQYRRSADLDGDYDADGSDLAVLASVLAEAGH